MSINCAYHENRPAVTNCQRCKRPICLQDKRVYKRRRGKYGYIKRDYCILCNASQKESDFLGQVIIFPLALIVFVVMIGMSGQFSGISAFVIVIALVFGIALVASKVQKDEAVEEAWAFKNRLSKTKRSTKAEYAKDVVIPQFLKKRDLGKINCFECGFKLEPGDVFCANCGDDTKEEFASLGNVE